MAKPKNKKEEHEKNKITKLRCNNCVQSKLKGQFYNSASVFHSGTGKIPYCKECLKNMALDENKRLDHDKLKKILYEADKPYLYYVLQSSYDEARKNDENLETDKEVVGKYFKNINSLNQYKNLTWDDSELEPEEYEYDKGENEVDETNEEIEPEKILNEGFEVTDEIVKRWGKYTPEEYHKLEQFYWDMREMNKIETPQEEAYLKKLALISMKMDKELEEGKYQQVKQLGELFSKYMADSEFRRIDKTDADRTGGLRGFGQIYAEVEKDDFIPPWEKYRKLKGVKQDTVDRSIMHIENFNLRLNKVNTMTEPPSDTPKLEEDEVDEYLGQENKEVDEI